MADRTISAVQLPKTQRKLAYDYSSTLENVRTMLADGDTPGDGPFDTAGKARAAANSLLTQLGEDGKKYGARVVQQSDGFYFGLKEGRKQYTKKDAEAAADAPAATPAKPSGRKRS